ncbi:DUF4199 domain-containing protein [Mastigocoleus testarum]|uniref:Uncharacterized protein n=1 Tax=Mastigocoleus testarum BC008 TaxID=371196 RepID=A0A0V7ZIF4_9CYAN|nr:DUF4199 domain-containing protein [Mastigocoleus testarum]KST63598.1 hypothetical protein BC008_14155 [Mastigocoleus testarum BC008]KST64172.1 hypothetical protein BC008_16155 [Mastigocoleus testarum BC008]
MALNPTIMQAVEKLDYRVTVGDIATQAGLNIAEASQGLLALATEAGGHLQVADDGDIVYLFPKNFRQVLRNKNLRLQLQEWWQKIWGVLFYLIRISFGIFLIVSIALIYITIIVVISAANSDRDNDDGGSFSFGTGFFYFPDLFWFFGTDYNQNQYQRRNKSSRDKSDLNFFESVFSFLFGDGNPNANLEERRWREIGTIIRSHKGAVVAEQISPYLDDIGETYQQDYEDYMLPVLSRFNGQPQVSPQGEIVYYFPELQVTATKKSNSRSKSNYLQEFLWRFSKASSGQIMLSVGLGAANLIGALILGNLLGDGTLAQEIGGLVGFVQGIYWLLLAYGIGFLGVPLIRYFWIQWRNGKIEQRNSQRQARANLLNSGNEALQEKITFSRQFAQEKAIAQEDLVYTTETDLFDQEIENSAKLDAEWQKRLNQS